MKKIILSSVLPFILGGFLFSQTNLLPTSGKAGIGTTSPLEYLQIHKGNILLTGDWNASGMGTLKFSHFYYPNAWAGISAKMNGHGWDQLDLLFYTAYGAPSEKMRIMSLTGNVGIGTSVPQAKLDVNGTTYSKQLFVGKPDANTMINMDKNLLAVNGTAVFVKAKVALYGTAWPDYVFNKEYQLPSLTEIESFIKLNGHLPEVPKAEEVEKNGIDLGSNQVLLLKKIEELTLIVIEQNKRIDELEKEIKSKIGKPRY